MNTNITSVNQQNHMNPNFKALKKVTVTNLIKSDPIDSTYKLLEGFSSNESIQRFCHNYDVKMLFDTTHNDQPFHNCFDCMAKVEYKKTPANFFERIKSFFKPYKAFFLDANGSYSESRELIETKVLGKISEITSQIDTILQHDADIEKLNKITKTMIEKLK